MLVVLQHGALMRLKLRHISTLLGVENIRPADNGKSGS